MHAIIGAECRFHRCTGKVPHSPLHNRGKSIILPRLLFYHYFPTEKIMKTAVIRSLFFRNKTITNCFCGQAGARTWILQGEFIQTVVDYRRGKHLSQSLVLMPDASLAPQLSAPLYTVLVLIIKSQCLCMRCSVFKISSEEKIMTHSNFAVAKYRHQNQENNESLHAKKINGKIFVTVY